MKLLEDDKVILVFTCETVEEILEFGGSQFWVVDKEIVKKCKYLITTRNRNHKLSGKEEQHREGFLVGRISGVERPNSSVVAGSRSDRCTEEERKKRWLIKIDEYACISCLECWDCGNQRPTRYKTVKETKIGPCCLTFTKVPPRN